MDVITPELAETDRDFVDRLREQLEQGGAPLVLSLDEADRLLNLGWRYADCSD